MDNQVLYDKYKRMLGSTPEFLKKYLELDILKRLMDISFFCGMEYGSKKMYEFHAIISRFDHSLNTALITWRLTHDKKSTLAALFHDVASPAFSHVIDYMNKDYMNQESTEEKTADIILSSKELRAMLESDGVDIEDIINYKGNPVVDQNRPHLCADRIEGLISVSIGWTNMVSETTIKEILNSLVLLTNEYGELEIGINNEDIARKVFEINQEYIKRTQSINDFYMMDLMAKIIKKCLFLKLFTYEDLYHLGEHDIIDIIEEEKSIDIELESLWLEFKTTDKPRIDNMEETKVKRINPLIFNHRLFQSIKN